MHQFVVTLYKDGVFIASAGVGDKALVVGRAYECDVRLADGMVSRKHARFWVEDNALYVEDLNSRNGIYVNRNRVTRSALKIRDEVAIGNHIFVVDAAAEQETLVDTGSMINFEKASDIYESIVREEGRGYLPILYKAAQLMSTALDLDSLLRQVLALVLEALRVRRGFVLTLTPGTREPKIRACLPEDAQGPPLSRALLRSVFEDKSAVMTVNALQDDRFDASASVVAHGIHSAMCVPLCGRSEIIGALYVDSGKDTVVFTNDDLELLTALGRVVGVSIENANLHEEKLRTERLAAIGQATAGIGHCVKGLMVGVKGGGEFIEKGLNESDWEWVRKGWGLVRRSSERIEDLLLNMLTFSRDPRPRCEPVSLPMLVSEVFDVVRARAERRRVTLELCHDEDVGTVLADNRDMFRVLMNLVNNAIDACEDNGGAVKVSIRKDADGSYIEVADTGSGISPEVADRLFQAFVSTKGSRGTGLGLVCCERLVHAHHGEIWVDSTPGKGATFTVFLPANPGQPSPTAPRPTVLSQVADRDTPKDGSSSVQ